jgi:hypothetical protein
MPLSLTEIVKASEICREELTTISGLAATRTAEQVTQIQADITLYDANKNDIDFAMKGGRDGVILSTQTLLSEIRMRVRKHFGLPLMSDEELELLGDSLQMVEIDTGVSTLYG